MRAARRSRCRLRVRAVRSISPRAETRRKIRQARCWRPPPSRARRRAAGGPREGSAMPASMASRGRARCATGSPSTQDSPESAGVSPNSVCASSRAARSDQAGEPDESRRAGRASDDVVECRPRAVETPRSSSATSPGATVTLREDRRRARGRPSGGSARARLTSLAGRVPTVSPSRSTVTRSAIAQHLLQPMRDVDDAGAVRPAARAMTSNRRSTSRSRQRSGRLVHDEDPGVDADAPWRSRRAAARACSAWRPSRSGSIAAPTRAERSRRARAARRQSIRRHAPPRSSASAMFSATVRCGNSAGCW